MQALIIIDMQETPMNQGDKHECEAVIYRINNLASAVREHAGAVVFIQHEGNEEEGLAPGTKGWKITHKLRHLPADMIFTKNTNNAFYDTGLTPFLQKNNISDLIFCGWATDYCVDSSIKAAISLEYKVSIAADCHTVSDREQINAPQVIQYFNALWAGMIAPTTAVKVKSAATLIEELSVIR